MRAGVRADQIEDVVREAEKEAAEGSPAEDAQPLLAPGDAAPGDAAPGTGAAWDDPVTGTGIGVFRSFSAALGEAFGVAAAAGQRLYGFAQHRATSTFLGTSTGLRLRHDQPAGLVDVNAKSADLARSAWAGQGTRDFADVDVGALLADLTRRLEWAKRRVELPAGRYETLLPPAAVADLLIYLYWSAGAKDALDGRTVFSKPGGGTRVGERLSGLPLTRDGTYLVENGEVTAAVNNFRFNESPVSMLARVTEVGATGPALSREWGDYFTRTAMPPLRVEGFNMSSVSQAS